MLCVCVTLFIYMLDLLVENMVSINYKERLKCLSK